MNDEQTLNDEEACGMANRPLDVEPCGLEPCASSWVKGTWSEVCDFTKNYDLIT